MAWNKPTSNTVDATSSSRPAGRGKMPRLRRGLLAGVIVVLGAGIAAWLFTNGEAASSPLQRKDRGLIKEATPAVVRTNVVEEVKDEVPYWEVDASQTNGFTKAMLHKWRDKHSPPPGYVYKSLRKKSKWHIFEHKSENMIASLLRYQPGKASFGRPHFTGLTEDFLKSCQVPIIVTAGDDEYTAKLKRDMNQTKIELKARIDAGESLEQIIEDTRDEYRKLSQFKRSLEKEVHALVDKEARTVEDVETFEAAANKLLEAKGIAPLKFSAITKERLLNLKGEDEL